MAQSISDAINEVTEDSVEDETTEETAEETTSEETSETTEGESTLLDEEDTEEETEEEEEAEEEPAEEEATEEAQDPSDIFDNLTAEQLAEIKANPALNNLRKALMKGYNSKTTEHSQLVQLGNAYKQDPYGVLRAIALQLGMDVVPPQQQQQQQQQAVDPGKELEDLFGEQIGPKVRAVFDKWAEARFGQRLNNEVAPLRDALGRVISHTEAARMQNEESTFKSRHRELTPQMEKAIVDLGNSGRIVPGRMNPQEYLETLYDIVSAREARRAPKKQQTAASARLASRIEANRRDREPSGQSGRGSKVKQDSKIPQAKNISEALNLAMEELEAEEGR